MLASLRKHGGAAWTLLNWMDIEQYRGARCVNRKAAAGKAFQGSFTPFSAEPRQVTGRCGEGETL